MKRSQITVKKVKRPGHIGKKWWDMIKHKGYFETLQKLGKPGKLELDRSDYINLREMQKIHKDPGNYAQRRENEVIKSIRDYYLSLRRAYITEKKGVSEIVKDIKENKRLVADERAYQAGITKDMKKVGWAIRPRHEVNIVKNAIEIFRREDWKINPKTIKELQRQDFTRNKLPPPSKGSHIRVIRKKLLAMYERGEFK